MVNCRKAFDRVCFALAWCSINCSSYNACMKIDYSGSMCML